jgi:hypothetical protein
VERGRIWRGRGRSRSKRPRRVSRHRGSRDHTCGLPFVARNRRYYCRRIDAPMSDRSTRNSTVRGRGERIEGRDDGFPLRRGMDHAVAPHVPHVARQPIQPDADADATRCHGRADTHQPITNRTGLISSCLLLPPGSGSLDLLWAVVSGLECSCSAAPFPACMSGLSRGAQRGSRMNW